MPIISDSVLVSTHNTGSALLKELLESAHNLPKASTDLGTIQLSLNEIRKKANHLRKNKDDRNTNFTKAHYLLAGSGITAEEIEAELKSIEVHQSLEASSTFQPSYSNDIDSYLRAKKDENILSAIEQSLVLAAKDFDNFVNQNITMDWKQRRDEIRESFGIILNKRQNNHDGKDENSKRLKMDASKLLTWGKSNPSRDILLPISIKTNYNNKQLSRERFEIHAEVIYHLNESRIKRKHFNVALNFGAINKLETNVRAKQLSDSWKYINDLVDERSNKLFEEKKYMKAYNNFNSINDFDSINLRKKIVEKSKNYLEKQFLDYINKIYKKDLSTQRSRGHPTNVNKVTSFINKIMKSNTDKIKKTLNVNGVPIWALIFYLLRAGCLKDALDLTLKNDQVFQKYEKSFPAYLKSFVESPNRRLPQELHERLHTEFNQHFNQLNKDLDPYRYAVYKIIGRCDLAKKNLPYINLSIEDWLWCHLSLTREDNVEEDPMHERYTLLDLQKTIMNYGPERFNGSNNNPFYLKALIFTGLFEIAIQYVYTLSECDAVHLAIGLAYYGLLRVSEFQGVNDNNLITVDEDSQQQINFARLLGSYTRAFRNSDPKIAAQYLILICMGGDQDTTVGKEQVEISHESLIELCLQTREFSSLLGQINVDGSRTPGVIEQRKELIDLKTEEQFLHKITEQAAIKADEEGRTFDAMLLYQLSEEFDTVIASLNKLMGEVLSFTELDKPLIEPRDTYETNIILLSQQLMKTFNNNPHIMKKVLPKNRETCNMLLRIVSIREEFLKQNWEATLLKIGNLKIIPTNPDDDLLVSRKMAEEFNDYDESIAKNVPTFLVMTMTSIAQLTHQLSKSEFQTNSKKDNILKLRETAKNCMIYAGMVQYRMPRETYSLLISLEAML